MGGNQAEDEDGSENEQRSEASTFDQLDAYLDSNPAALPAQQGSERQHEAQSGSYRAPQSLLHRLRGGDPPRQRPSSATEGTSSSASGSATPTFSNRANNLSGHASSERQRPTAKSTKARQVHPQHERSSSARGARIPPRPSASAALRTGAKRGATSYRFGRSGARDAGVGRPRATPSTTPAPPQPECVESTTPSEMDDRLLNDDTDLDSRAADAESCNNDEYYAAEADGQSEDGGASTPPRVHSPAPHKRSPCRQRSPRTEGRDGHPASVEGKQWSDRKRPVLEREHSAPDAEELRAELESVKSELSSLKECVREIEAGTHAAAKARASPKVQDSESPYGSKDQDCNASTHQRFNAEAVRRLYPHLFGERETQRDDGSAHITTQNQNDHDQRNSKMEVAMLKPCDACKSRARDAGLTIAGGGWLCLQMQQ